MSPAIFLDRDGVLNPTVSENGLTRAPKCLAEFQLLPGVREALERLAERFPIVVLTNQAEVARGLIKRDEVEAIHDRLRDTLPIRDVLACFHDDWDRCHCRKPKPGLFFDAARHLGLDLSRSFSVGDHWIDIAASQAAGCGTAILIDNPGSERQRCRPDFRIADLCEAADRILNSAQAA